MGGWLKLHRKMLEWSLYHDLPAFRLFLHLLLTVDYRSRQEDGETMPAGSRKARVIDLSNETGLSVMQVRYAIDKLVKNGCIMWTTKRKAGGVVSVCNWEEYQGDGAENGEKLAISLAKTLAIKTPSQTIENEEDKQGFSNNVSNNISNNVNNNPCVLIKNIEENNKTTHAHAHAHEGQADTRFPDLTTQAVLETATAYGCNWSEADASAFIAHYESIGWRLPSGAIITNWRARVKAFDANRPSRQVQPPFTTFDTKQIGTFTNTGVQQWR